MKRRSLDALPLACVPINDLDLQRLRLRFPDMWSDPEHSCITCDKQGWFRARVAGSIVEFDCDCVSQWMLHVWLLKAGIGLAYQRLSIDDALGIDDDALVVINDYAQHVTANLRFGRGLTLWSTTKGTGKTFLATLLVKLILNEGYDAYFTQYNELLDFYTNTWRDKDERIWFDRMIRNIPFLVIDDLGRENKGRLSVSEAMLDLVIRARSAASLPTIVTTNLNLSSELRIDEVTQGYGDNVASLLSGSNVPVHVGGTDYRPFYLERLNRDVRDNIARPVVMV